MSDLRSERVVHVVVNVVEGVRIVILSMELLSRVLKGVHRGERVVPQVDPELGERIVARVQVEALIRPESLVAHAW